MPAQRRTADQRPKRTPSFVCEVPLRVHPHEERTLLARLEAARQVYNACLGEAHKRVQLVRESKAFRAARTRARGDPERTRLFRTARQQHGFSDYALQAYAKPLGHAWLGEHLDSHVLQKLASRAYGAANRLLVGQAKRVRRVGQSATG
jgi:putative transposase